MINARSEVDFRRLERVVGWEVDGKEENSPRVWTIALFSRVNL